MLELVVRVININPKAGHELLEKCPVLKEYGQFVDTIRKYQENGEEDAYEYAIKECIQKGILADYLEKKGSEVVNMLIAEYDYETDIEVQREEAYEEGERAGRIEGERTGRIEGERTGRSEGELFKLVKMTVKKLKKGNTAEETAKMLEEPIEMIQMIYDVADEYAPEYDVENIFKKCR